MKLYYQNQGSIILTQREYRHYFAMKCSSNEFLIVRLITSLVEGQGIAEAIREPVDPIPLAKKPK